MITLQLPKKPLTFKMNTNKLPTKVVEDLNKTILNSIINLKSYLDKTNREYLTNFILGGFTNKMIVDTKYLDDIIHILETIGFSEEEIHTNYTLDEDDNPSKDVEVYCYIGRVDFIKELLDNGIIKKRGLDIDSTIKELNITMYNDGGIRED